MRPSAIQLFAEQINNTILVPDGIASFGDDKLFISSVYFEGEGGFSEDMSLDMFKKELLQAHRSGLVVISRGDLVEAMDPELVERSEIRDPVGGEYHFINRRQTNAAVRKAIGLPPKTLKENHMATKKKTPKKKSEKDRARDIAEEIRAWFDNTGDNGFSQLVFRLLASLRGGDQLEDMGYEPFDGIGYVEADMIGRMLIEASTSSFSTEEIVQILTRDDSDTEVNEQRTAMPKRHLGVSKGVVRNANSPRARALRAGKRK